MHGAEGSNGEWDDIRDFRAADFVTDEEGTGFVHCAPSHGMEEFELYRGLGMLEEVITYNVMEDGTFRNDLPFFGGNAILKPNGKEGDANKAVIDKLAEVGGLLARGKIKHSYPHCWRSKAPVIYRNTPQWFAAIDREVGDGQDEHGKTIRQRALTEIDHVNWTPRTGRNRLHSMMEARPDWVLSRQRAWGVPLTCFTKKGAMPTDPDFLLRNEEVNARIVEAFEAEGADAWYMDGAKERFLGGIVDPEEVRAGHRHSRCMVRFRLHPRLRAARPRGRDAGRDRGCLHGGHGPAPRVVPFVAAASVRDDRAGALSQCGDARLHARREGHEDVQDPGQHHRAAGGDHAVRRGYPAALGGADGLHRRPADRAGDPEGRGRQLPPAAQHDAVHAGIDERFSEADRTVPAEMPELERWVLHRLAELDAEVRKSYRAFDFQNVFQVIFQFATVDLSAFYFDVRKDALYCDGDTLRRRSARTVLQLLFERLTTWLAPILPFTMEDVWLDQRPGEDSSVHLQDFPETPGDWRDEALAAKWAGVRRARRVVTAALEVQRAEKVIGASLEAAPVVHVEDAALLKALKSVDFTDLCITSDLSLTADPVPAEAFRLPEAAGIGVVFEKAAGTKCQRCWKVLPDVGQHAHPGVCGRCDAALA